MKKITLFVLAVAAAMFLLSKLPNSAHARVIVFPTPTPGIVISSR